MNFSTNKYVGVRIGDEETCCKNDYRNNPHPILIFLDNLLPTVMSCTVVRDGNKICDQHKEQHIVYDYVMTIIYTRDLS